MSRVPEHLVTSRLTIPSREEEISSNESELRHLRLKLRAIEILCNDSMSSPLVDQDLVRSIENWKSDWATLRDAMSMRKKIRRQRFTSHHQISNEEGDSTLTSMTTTDTESTATLMTVTNIPTFVPDRKG